MNFDKQMAFRIGRPLAPLYAGMMRLRAEAYQRGWLASERLSVPVVSVGNLTMGGTGKTPMVIEVVRLLQALGKRAAVVSRGYGGLARGPVNLVSDGERIWMAAAEAGDEPLLLAESLPGVPVLTGVRRVLVARYAIEKLGAEVVVLDDGFQHLPLHRDLDLVLFKGPDFLGNGRVFPGGDLREPLSA
ncbi:MAG TPA: tetraacyldisaccharide 4'-kinase, partial [Desulfurivibrionaceae bacterium]|nr:tetraacyldisaccharide 4'-kinase [Desulfurivibrionaceae bacterium]